MKTFFRATRLFLPRGGYERWAVPAADSHPDDREFWERVVRESVNAPSSLHCILPDVCREGEDPAAPAHYMYDLLVQEKLERLRRGFMFVERTMKSGLVRSGIVAALDLECFSYADREISAARATEGPSDRVEALLKLRQQAVLEFPHALLLYRDPKCSLPRALQSYDLEVMYDFTLSDGGRLVGSFITEEDAERVAEAMAGRGEPRFAVVDGHDELIAAKKHWEELKPTLRSSELKNHPARFALVECINLFDPAVQLLPVHRLVTDTDGEAFLDYFAKNIPCERRGRVLIPALPASPESVRRVDETIAACLRANGGSVAYPTELKEVSGEDVGILLKGPEKKDLFYFLKSGQLFPRHTLTIGEENKRFHLEGREISYD